MIKLFYLLNIERKRGKSVFQKILKIVKNFEENVYAVDQGCGNLISKSQISCICFRDKLEINQSNFYYPIKM